MQPFYHEGFVEVGGETLHLVCNFRAIDIIESVTGESMDDILPQLAKAGHSLAVKVLFGLLCEKHPGITLDQVAGIGLGKDSTTVGVVMGDVIRRAYPQVFGDDKENPPKPRGRSKASTKSGSPQG